MRKYCHADLFVANAPHENRAKGVSLEQIRVEQGSSEAEPFVKMYSL